jgi:hypothetical protein
MNLWQVLLFTINIGSAKLFTKVIQTPILESDVLFAKHHIVLLQKTPFIESQTEYLDVYAVDFSPTDDITDPGIAWKIFLGKRIPGKVRLIHFDHIDDATIFRKPLDNYPTQPFKAIAPLDIRLYKKLQDWTPTFQLYTRNCQHFGRYIVS